MRIHNYFLRAENILVTHTENEEWKDSSTPEASLMPASNHSANITAILMSNDKFLLPVLPFI